MSIYIVGDIQGCLTPLQRLLEKAKFDPEHDELWSVGDIVNRGPASLETLRYLKNLGNSFKMVLGNHDLHLIAVARKQKPAKKGDTLDDILRSDDCDELINWLRKKPLIYKNSNTMLVHAGIPHIWSIEKALDLAEEVQLTLRGELCDQFLSSMYGNQPDIWSDQLEGMDRLRVITNYLTRMRICKPDGALDLQFKSAPDHTPQGYRPWFDFYPQTEVNNTQIFFGHWAALESKCYANRFHALDSGCVWGKYLTLFNLNKGSINTEKFSI